MPPPDAGYKLHVYKMFRRSPGHLMYVYLKIPPLNQKLNQTQELNNQFKNELTVTNSCSSEEIILGPVKFAS